MQQKDSYHAHWVSLAPQQQRPAWKAANLARLRDSEVSHVADEVVHHIVDTFFDENELEGDRRKVPIVSAYMLTLHDTR